MKRLLQHSVIQISYSFMKTFDTMARMEDDQLVKRIMGSNVRGVRLRDRQQMGWMDSVKKALTEREIIKMYKIGILHISCRFYF